jgi:hypothetical protein
MTTRLNNLPAQPEINALLRVAMSRHIFYQEPLYIVSGYRTTQDKDDVCFLVLAAGQSLLFIRSGAGGCVCYSPHWVKVAELEPGRPYATSDRRDFSMLYIRSVTLLEDSVEVCNAG